MKGEKKMFTLFFSRRAGEALVAGVVFLRVGKEFELPYSS